MKHHVKVYSCLSFRNSVVWPTSEVDLRDLLLLPVWESCLDLAPLEERAFLDVLQQRHVYFLRFLRILTYVKVHFFVLGPEPIALRTSVFFGSTGAHDHCHVLFDDHLPKVVCRLRQWPLRRNNPPITLKLRIEISKRRVDKTGIDIVRVRPSCNIDSLLKSDPRLLICYDVDIPVSMMVFLGEELLGLHFLSFEERLKNLVISIDRIL